MKTKIFKKIYIEITNRCNLSCSFCSKTKRTAREMSVEEFKIVIEKIKLYTDYIYLHVKGEPLIHSHLEQILKIAYENQIKVNITTNGVNLMKMIDVLFTDNSIRQLNISLHALEAIPDKEEYMQGVVEMIRRINDTNKFFLSLRIWIDNQEVNNFIYDYLYKKLKIDNLSKLGKNIFWSYDTEFEWPSLENDNLGNVGKCLGTKSHIAILSNGDVVPCCLDGNGIMKLGNVFIDEMESIIKGKRFNDIKNGFNENKLVEELCQKCKYRRK